jgi:hypothetical protein
MLERAQKQLLVINNDTNSTLSWGSRGLINKRNMIEHGIYQLYTLQLFKNSTDTQEKLGLNLDPPV